MDPFIFIWATEEPPLPPNAPAAKSVIAAGEVAFAIDVDKERRQHVVRRWLAHLRKKGATK